MTSEDILNEMYQATRNLRLTALEHEQLREIAQNIHTRIIKDEQQKEEETSCQKP